MSRHLISGPYSICSLLERLTRAIYNNTATEIKIVTGSGSQTFNIMVPNSAGGKAYICYTVMVIERRQMEVLP
jgi:hypothetical protein